MTPSSPNLAEPTEHPGEAEGYSHVNIGSTVPNILLWREANGGGEPEGAGDSQEQCTADQFSVNLKLFFFF